MSSVSRDRQGLDGLVERLSTERTRWVRRFAIFPRKMGSGYLQSHGGPWVWLGFYYELRHFWVHSGTWDAYCGGVVWTLRPWSLNRAETPVPVAGCVTLRLVQK